MKTKKEIQEADRRELEIAAEREAADKAAHREFGEATKEAWNKYEAVWKPAKEEWEAFSSPYFKVLQAKLAVNEKTESGALSEVRSNWKVCPRCGTPAGRYQVYCLKDTCGVSLLDEPARGGL